ncbi:MAG: hypothetical protein WD960_10035 [Gemmatimonadota bacterium]
MSNWSWVIAAYGLAWLVLGGYGWLVLRRLSRAQADLVSERNRPSTTLELDS